MGSCREAIPIFFYKKSKKKVLFMSYSEKKNYICKINHS